MTFLQSRPEDTDISRKGTHDDISRCMLPNLESDGSQLRLCRSHGRRTLTSPGKVQVTTLVTACYRTLSLTDSERVCAGYRIGCLRVPTDSQVTIAKGGVVDKNEVFAPTYPQFVMRNSDLRSS